MEQRLKGCLLSYMIQNSPELLMALQSDQKVSEYIEQKVTLVGPLLDNLIREETPTHEVEAECLKTLTEDLRPSKFRFISRLLEKEFPHYYQRLKAAGTITLEITNIISTSIDIFDTFGFTEKSEEDIAFLYAIKNAVFHHFKTYGIIGI